MSELTKQARTNYILCIGPKCENWQLITELCDYAEELEAENKKIIEAGWRSCIDHIIKPEHPCPVCRTEQLESALEDAKLFANWVECLGRTDCEIYKHELKAASDLSLERITKALHRVGE